MLSAVRIDRYLTLSVFQMLHRPGGEGGKHVPILMYHGVSDDREDGVEPYYRLATDPRRFAEQMQWLRDSGYRGVSLETALAMPANGESGAGPLAVITFDDGLRDFYTTAGPIIQRHGFTATMYLPTAFIASQRKSFRGKECLTWDEVRELRAHGFRFGSHTVNHPKLHELSWNAVENELRLSKEGIEQELGEAVASFAYPYAFPQEDGHFTKTFTELLRGQGYRSCVTTVVGRMQPDDDPFCLKRLPVNSCDDKALFTAKLNGAYDWLSVVQKSFRFGKAWAKCTLQRVEGTRPGAHRELIQP
jgi:peptidoglycan/xylan/chitin deacetylase (PgdA/CDA1 family)